MAEYFESHQDVNASQGEQEVIRLSSMKEELSRRGVDPACIDFILHLLVVDEDRRPTAVEALQHPWLRGVSPD